MLVWARVDGWQRLPPVMQAAALRRCPLARPGSAMGAPGAEGCSALLLCSDSGWKCGIGGAWLTQGYKLNYPHSAPPLVALRLSLACAAL